MSTTSTLEIILPAPLPAHPRLLASPDDWIRLRRHVREDTASARIFATLQKKADELLTVLPVERVVIGRRLLKTSRDALERISLLSLVACIGGDDRYARRAIAEMLQAAGFSDWNPSHYLDTAEMSLALAIGYDWLHDHLSQDEKDTIATALRDKGIAPSLTEPEQWFIRGTNNWNQVCHAGLSAAAISIADREPDLCRRILQRAVDNLPYAAGSYAPDGAYVEGPMYWNYGTLFHTVLAAALQRFLGSTCGVDSYPGFAASAEYVTQMTTPSGAFYPYADCRMTRHLLIPLFWFARQFKRPDWLATELAQIDECMESYETGDYDDSNYRLLALALLWRDPKITDSQDSQAPRHWLGRGPMPVAVHRSAFQEPLALYAAIKGGSPALSHAHMDVGSFLLQSDGVVWAKDFGMQEYHSLESIGINLWDRDEKGTRWTIFRLGPEGHNILRFNGAPQVVAGNAQFVRFHAEGSTPHSVLDLSPVYAGQAERVQRGLMILENRAILIQDEWTAGEQGVAVTWQMITEAEVSVSSREITLSQQGKTLRLILPETPRGEVKILDTAVLEKPFDTPNPGAKRLEITLRTEARQSACLRIFAVPGPSAELPPAPLRSLCEWSAPLPGSP
jgi:hypothetical protein